MLKNRGLIIIQARLCSRRLPNKVLMTINNKPLIEYLIDSLQELGIEFIIATSREKSDIPLIEYCIRNSIQYFAGELNNVAGRFVNLLKKYNPEYFIRLCADSPLLDYQIIEKAINLYKSSKCDICCNLLERTYPKGMSVEVIRTEFYLNNYDKFEDTEDFEHVTKYFYKSHEQFNILNFKSDIEFPIVQLSVDTKDDFIRVSKVIGLMKKPHWKYRIKDIVKLNEKV